MKKYRNILPKPSKFSHVYPAAALFWVPIDDDDGKKRYTKLKIMTEASIKEMAFEFKMGKTITKIAKESKFCFRRVKKLIDFMRTLKDFDYDIAVRDMHCEEAYKYMNAKSLLMEEINERQL